jgi:hypothetical protein
VPTKRLLPRTFTLEALEARWCPSTTSVRLSGDTLRITGDNSHNEVAVVQNDSHDSLDVVADGFSYHFFSSRVHKVVVDLKGGDDSFTWRMDSDRFTFRKDLSLALGTGNDSAVLDFSAGDQVTIAADLKVSVDAGDGVDDARAFFGDVDSSGSVNFSAAMGNGDDSCFVAQEGSLHGRAQVKIALDGGAGNDTLSVHADHAFIDRSSLLDISANGGSGVDRIEFVYFGELHGQLKLSGDGGAGDDTLFADVTLDTSSDGRLWAREYGESDRDDLTLRVYDPSRSPSGYHGPARVDGLVDGGSGWDSCSVTPGIRVVNCELRH